MHGNLIVRYAVDQGVRLIGLAVALFWSAGTLAWWPAWALIAVSAAWMVARATVIIRNDPSLLAERLAPPKGAKKWDAVLIGVHGLLQMGVYVIGGLQHRFGWTPPMPAAAQIAALLVCASGYAIIAWATACNPYFSLVVRIQTDRGHTVATEGPYRIVRHPAYAGGILFGASLGMVLGSWWAFVVGLVDSALMILRTHLEDRDLRRELPGYSDYARRVRFRLIPGIW